MKFDDIDLNNDKSAPKLDLDFGSGGTEDKCDKKSAGGGGFSFGGGWGGGWGGASTSWGFGGAEEKKEEEKPVDDGWGFASSKKEKEKKKKDAGFDFNFDSLAGDGEDLGAPAKKEEKPIEEDPWYV